MCVIEREVRVRWTTLIRLVLLGKHVINSAVATIIIGTTRHNDLYTTEVWYIYCVCAWIGTW